MDLQFSNQRGDQMPSEERTDTVETVEAAGSAAIAETPDTGAPLKRSDRAGQQRLPWRAVVHTVASQDYIGVLIAIVALVLIIGSVRPDFFNVSNLLDILRQSTTVALLACGMAFLLAMRELDLSVGAIYGLTTLCAATLIHDDQFPS